MKREYEILVNQYGQGVVDFEKIALVFNTIELSARKEFFVDLISLIQQSKVQLSLIHISEPTRPY